MLIITSALLLSAVPSFAADLPELPDWLADMSPEQIESLLEVLQTMTDAPAPPDNPLPPLSPADLPEFSPEFPSEPPLRASTPFNTHLPYAFPLTGGGLIHANVPNGMITSSEVMIETTAGIHVTRDGEEVMWTGLELDVSRNGFYEIYSENNLDRPAFVFTIAADYVNFIDTYTAPDGFLITNVNYEGGTVVLNNREFYFVEDGPYFITLEQDIEYFPDTERERFYVSMHIDRTPPVLTFQGLDENNVGSDRVTFTVDKEAEIRIVRNSRPFTQNFAVLTEPGHYLVIAVDNAGNEAVYELRIAYRMDSAGYWFISLFSLLAMGLAVYLIRGRRKFRVR
jgi:hypothetical protein